MGAYAYCSCGQPLLGPWDLSTRDLLRVLILKDEDGGVKCPGCGEKVLEYSNFDYHLENIIDELSERIDKSGK
jgi:DNA-directed RNA polymerase subunit RPC12/RpoP